MGRTVEQKPWAKTQPLRRDQVTQLERLAARLSALTDDELYKLRMEWGDVVERLYAERDELDAEMLAQMALSDVLVVEINYRLGVVWNAESEMMGGHRVHISKDDETLGMWRGRCAPRWEYTDGEQPCWEGPERTHVEDAIEDARRHHPGHEPWHIEY